MGSVTVHINTTVEHGGGVFAKGRVDHGLSTRVVLDEISHVVDDTGNGNEAAAVLGLVDEIIPLHDGELVEGNTPIQFRTGLVKLLLQLLETTLFNLVAAELLEIICETELLPDPDGPLCGIILVPLNGVSVVGGELVVEVVISFTQGDQSSDDVVARRVAVVKGLVSEPMGQ